MHYLPTCDTERTSNDKLKRLGLRTYPNNPAALRAMRAQAKCRKAM